MKQYKIKNITILGREKTGWNNPTLKPEWWPKDISWSSVSKDQRTATEIEKIPFPEYLRKIITSCYKYFHREDILNASEYSGNGSEKNNNSSVDIEYAFANEYENNDFERVDNDYLNNINQNHFDNDGRLILKINNRYFDTENAVINVPVPLSIFNTITECSQNNPERYISVTFNEKQE